MDPKDVSESPIEQESVRQDEKTVRIDDEEDGSFFSKQEENVSDDAAKSEKTDKILESQSHDQKEIVDVNKEDNDGIDKDGSPRSKETDKVISNVAENIKIVNKGVEPKSRKGENVDDNTEKNVKIGVDIQNSQYLEETESSDYTVKNERICDTLQESQCLKEKENMDDTEKNVKFDKAKEPQAFEQKDNVDSTENVLIEETGGSTCSKDMEHVVSNMTELLRIDTKSKEFKSPEEENVDDNTKGNKTFIYSEGDHVLKYYSISTSGTKIAKSADELQTEDASASHKNASPPGEQDIPSENLEIVSGPVKPVQLAKEKIMLDMSHDDSSDKQESDESDNAYVIDYDDYYNWNDDLDALSDVEDNQGKESTPQKTILGSDTSAPLVDINCGETFSISGDSNSSWVISDVPASLDDSKIVNKGAKPKTSFVSLSHNNNLEPPTELLAKRISREVRRFFLLNPVETEDVSPRERHYQILTSPYFSDEFAREIGITLPAVLTDNIRNDYELILDEMITNSNRLKDALEAMPSVSENPNPTPHPTWRHSPISWINHPETTTPELADAGAAAACSAEIPDPVFKVQRWTDLSTELKFSHLYDEYYHAKQSHPLKLEESVESLREKHSAENTANCENAIRHLQAVGVSEEDFIRYFPIIQRKYGFGDDDQPVSELDEFLDPIIEDKIVSVMFDKGSILMAVLYVELRNKKGVDLNSVFNEKVAKMYSEDRDLNLAMEMSLNDCGHSSGSLPLFKVNHPCLLRDVEGVVKSTASESDHRTSSVSVEETKAIENEQTSYADQSMTYDPVTNLRRLEQSTDNCSFEQPTQRSDIDARILTALEDETNKSKIAYLDSSQPISGATCSNLSPSASENAVTCTLQAVDQSNIHDSTSESEDEASSSASSKHNMKTPAQPRELNYENYKMVRLIADYFFHNTSNTDSAFSSALISEEACTAVNPSSDNAVIRVTQVDSLYQSNIDRLAVISEGEEDSDGSSKDNVLSSTQPHAPVADSTMVHLTLDSDHHSQLQTASTFSEETCSGTNLSSMDSHVLQTRDEADQTINSTTTQTEVEVHEDEFLTPATHPESVDCPRSFQPTDPDILNQLHTVTTSSGLVSEETCSGTSLSTTPSHVPQPSDQVDQSNINSSTLEMEHMLSEHDFPTTLSDESNVTSTTQTEIVLLEEDSLALM